MKYVYTFILSCLSILALADGMHISGIITDMDTQKPVVGANVLLHFFQGFEFLAQTDSSGKYDVKTTAVVPEGYYSIEVEAKGYYKLNGFIHVIKESNFGFSIKSKDPKPSIPEAKKDTVKMIEKKTAALQGFATNNLVFLIDISSSMNMPDKMPLLKESMKYLVSELRSTDRVAILTFSNSTKEILPSTPANNKEVIYKTIDGLMFGSTSQGVTALDVAYKTAIKNFIQQGNNRIVLTSDGLFTSGEKDYKRMQQIIKDGTEKGISLSVFCFGKNTEYVKTKLQKLTMAGNGNFALISTIEEGKQHMLEEAKAVKNIQ